MVNRISTDTSQFQNRTYDNAYRRPWAIFRVCDGSYLDPLAAGNLAWCRSAKATGAKALLRKAARLPVLDGYTVYVVYRPGMNATIMANLNRFGVPQDAMVMIDLESWAGAITGNRSAELNDLAGRIALRQGSHDRVWGYGNRGDLAALWPQRPSWLGIDVASYGGQRPSGIANMIGWQYTNGQFNVAGLPNSSPPFGHCDHNELYLPTNPAPKGDWFDMASTKDLDARIQAAIPDIIKKLLRAELPDPDGVTRVGTVGQAIRDGREIARRTEIKLDELIETLTNPGVEPGDPVGPPPVNRPDTKPGA